MLSINGTNEIIILNSAIKYLKVTSRIFNVNTKHILNIIFQSSTIHNQQCVTEELGLGIIESVIFHL